MKEHLHAPMPKLMPFDETMRRALMVKPEKSKPSVKKSLKAKR